MIHQLYRIFLLLLLLTFFCYGQNITKIEYEFNDPELLTGSDIKDYKLKDFTQYQPGIKDTLEKRVFSFLRNKGYFVFNLTSLKESFSDDSTSVTYLIKIDEGKRYSIQNVIVEHDSADIVISSELKNELEGFPYDKDLIEASIQFILDDKEEAGFPFSKIRITSVTLVETKDSAYCNLFFKYEAGKLAAINKIKVQGNENTKDYVILRELRLQKEDYYSSERLEEYIANLNKLKFFNSVKIPGYYINGNNEGVLSILVEEAQTNSFDGIVGYVPPGEDEEDGYFTGFVNIGLRNLFGTGRSALIKWKREERLSQELELKYLEPWMFGLPVNLNAGLFQRKQDTTYVKRLLSATLDYLATRSFTAGLLIESESVIPSGDDTLRLTVYNSSKLTTGFNFRFDTTDDFYNPKKGIIFSSTYKFTSKQINGPKKFITDDLETEVNFQRIELDFEAYYSVFTNHILALGVFGREIKGPFFELSDLYYLGGTNSLRGYRERQFNGNRILWSNLEYRLSLSRKSYAFAFFDSGYYLRNANESQNIKELSNFKTGFGAGINIETGLGVMGISYALGEGDSFQEGKIHFGLINEF